MPTSKSASKASSKRVKRLQHDKIEARKARVCTILAHNRDWCAEHKRPGLVFQHTAEGIGVAQITSERDLSRYIDNFLIFAAANGLCSTARLLIDVFDRVDLDCVDDQCKTILMHASSSGNVQLVDLLINSKKCDAMAIDDAGLNSLMYAAKSVYADADAGRAIMKALLRAGISIHSRDEGGNTALIHASKTKGDHVWAINLLLQHSIDNDDNISAMVDAVNTGGNTSLMYACGMGNERVAARLIARRADVNAVNTSGWTPLMIACKYNREGAVKLLLQHAACVETRNKYDWNALMLCAKYDCRALLDRLLNVLDVSSSGSKMSAALLVAAKHLNLEILHVLLLEGANYRHASAKGGAAADKGGDGGAGGAAACHYAVDASGRTALMLACTHKNKTDVADVCRAIIDDIGSDLACSYVNAVDCRGHTALMYACECAHYEAVMLLLEERADVHVSNQDGTTALMLAADSGSIELVDLFIKEGADVNAEDRDRWTSLMLASLRGDRYSVQSLLEAGAKVSA